MISTIKNMSNPAVLTLLAVFISSSLLAQFSGFAVSSYQTTTQGCELCIDITINTNGATITSIEWDFMDGSMATSSLEDPCHAFPSEGSHYPQVTISGNVVVNGVTEKVSSVLTIPVEVDYDCEVTADYSICVKECEVCFTNESAGSSCTSQPVALGYVWDFGDGTSSTETNPCHVYTSAGAKQVSLTAIGNDEECSDETTQTVIIDEACQECKCEASAFLSRTQINNCTHQFNASIISSGECVASSLWSWDFGDGTTTTGGASMTHTFAPGGNYTITASITLTDPSDPNCTTTYTATTMLNLPASTPCFDF